MVASWWDPSRNEGRMKHESSMEGRAYNSVESSKKDNQGEKGSRLRVSLDALENVPSPRSIITMITLIYYKWGKDDWCITSSFGISMEDMTSRMTSFEGNSKSRMSCELGESTTYLGGVGRSHSIWRWSSWTISTKADGIVGSTISTIVSGMYALYLSTSSGWGTTQGSKELMDPLVTEEIMFIGATLIVGDSGGRGNIPINEGYLKILTLTLTKDCVVSLTKGYIWLRIGSKVWGT
jgi:hypothetical protein